MKIKLAILPILILAAFMTASASAQVQVGNMSVPATIANPVNSGINVNYSLFGSSLLASAQLRFFLSTTANGSSGFTEIFSRQLTLTSNGRGNFLPPSGPQTQFIAGFTLPASVKTFFQNLCQPQTLFILGRVDFGNIAGTNGSSMGTIKQPDFFFTVGTLTPGTIRPGDTTNVSFDLFTQCPANAPSRVGIFLADSAFNLLSFIGPVAIGAGAGTFSVPPIGITFSAAIPTGNYNLVIIADVDGVIAESNENNNAGSFALSIIPALSAVDESASELDPDTKLPDHLSKPGALDLRPSADYATKLQ